MLCDVAVQDAPPLMSDHEKAVQHAKPDGGNREEIHRGNRFLMVAQKSPPAVSDAITTYAPTAARISSRPGA